MGKFETIETSEYPNFVTSAKAGVQNPAERGTSIGMTVRRGHRSNLKLRVTHYRNTFFFDMTRAHVVDSVLAMGG